MSHINGSCVMSHMNESCASRVFWVYPRLNLENVNESCHKGRKKKEERKGGQENTGKGEEGPLTNPPETGEHSLTHTERRGIPSAGRDGGGGGGEEGGGGGGGGWGGGGGGGGVRKGR